MVLLADNEGPDDHTDAQADPGLRCPHMPVDMFLHGAAHIMVEKGEL